MPAPLLSFEMSCCLVIKLTSVEILDDDWFLISGRITSFNFGEKKLLLTCHVSEAPVLVHCGVSDGQRHHGHAVHVVWYTLGFLHVLVNPAGPRDPLQVMSTTTHNSSMALKRKNMSHDLFWLLSDSIIVRLKFDNKLIFIRHFLAKIHWLQLLLFCFCLLS